ncbi:MAG: sugar phosphate nucleotidyltransferase, partial [Planctomycetota bacterium]
MNSSTHVLILAGGKGQRLWPWSRPGCYKPFLPLLGQRSLLDATIERALSLVSPDRIHLVGSSEFVRESAPFLWIEEPQPRNTGPAIYHAARSIHEQDPSATLLVFPADHRVLDPDAFRRGLRDTLIEVDAAPQHFWLHGTVEVPDSSFGFIVPETAGESGSVACFIEKPDPDLALSLAAQGAIRNTGIFCFKAALLID